MFLSQRVSLQSPVLKLSREEVKWIKRQAPCQAVGFVVVENMKHVCSLSAGSGTGCCAKPGAPAPWRI